ncbi:hypothetical protein CNYM01_09317 [Colletotrichum nymphaeae SA-01]|uniref:C2H2-type domain-containing protein n=1 Tax=Colletotrichum nymphaeae SA-01 TaxID=1460502 RepID=A0A135S8F9_9PEZI|nr:hypothetical protein CNYM01_09317 [Colletotrichum nymphaeae SA-01]
MEHAEEKFRKQISPLALKNQYDRFKLWAANLGALHHGRASLDFRLMDSSLMKSTLLKFLNELRLVLSKSSEIVQGSRLPLEEALAQDLGEALEDFSDSDSSSSENTDRVFSNRTELGQNATETSQILSSLMKASFKIRQPLSRTAQLQHKAFNHKLSICINDTSTGDLLMAYSDFDRLHVEEMFRQFRKYTIEMDPRSAFRVSHRLGESGHYHDHLDQQLIDRWSKSITNRRRFFSYWKRHAFKLSRAAPPERAEDKHVPLRPFILATKQTDVQRPSEVQGSASQIQRAENSVGPPLVSETDATRYEENMDEHDTVSTVSYASTALDIGGSTSRLPPPPSIITGQHEFLCPYCHVLCPSKEAKGKRWREHIRHDLQPYMCTYIDCADADVMFINRASWTEHESQAHRRIWRCFEHGMQFSSQDSLTAHLESFHCDLGVAQIQSISELSVVSRDDERKACPFCLSFGPFKKDLINHMAFHMEELATFAISRSAGEKPEGDSLGTNSGATIGDLSADSLRSAGLDFSYEDLVESHTSGQVGLSDKTGPGGAPSLDTPGNIERESDSDTWYFDWSRFDDYEASRDVFFRLWHPGTLAWFLASADFKLWSSEKGHLLFIHGVPGVGKSVLASVVAHSLANTVQLGVATLICYGESTANTEEALLLSLLKQLSRSITSRPAGSLPLRQKRKDSPSHQEILEALKDVVAEFERVHIIVDGLDQLQDHTRMSLLRSLKKLNDQGVGVLTTSRTIPHMLRDMEGWPIVAFDSKADDIILWVREGNSPFRPLTPSAIAHVDRQVVRYSEGVFLFATFYLHLQSMTDSTWDRWDADPLNHFYARQMDRVVRSQHPELAVKLLGWVALSMRAITTTEAQAMFAFMDNIRPINKSSQPSLDSIISSCAGLLIVDEKDTIRFFHSTGLKHFLENQEKWFLNVAREQAELCCKYLSLDAFESGACSTLSEYKMRLQSHPFYEYAALHWGRNAVTAFMRLKDPRRFKASRIYKTVMRLFASEAKSQAAYQALTANEVSLGEPAPEKWVNLHLSVLFSFQQIVIEILPEVAKDHDFLRDESKARLIFLASISGNTVILEQLLHFMVTNIPIAIGRSLSHCQMAVGLKLGQILHTAVRYGHVHVVETLLKFHANEDLQGNQENLMCSAVENEHHEIVFALLKASISPNAVNSWLKTPLGLAIERGHENTVRLLLSHGADPNIPNVNDETPLFEAIIAGEWGITSVLLGYGANPNARTTAGHTPLELAIAVRDAKAIRLLLGYGADANAQSLDGTPLVLAARGEGLEEIVDNLLHRGADPNLPDSSGKTALEIASSSGSKTTELILTKFKESMAAKREDPAMRVLSAASSNFEDRLLDLLVEGGDANQGNSLYVASEKGFSAVVNALLVHGADPNAAGPDGTPLVIAAKNGHLDVVDALIAWGARLEEADSNGKSALSHAAQRGHLSIVKLLFESGAREDKRDLHGNLPADLALQSGHLPTRRFLLEVNYLQVSRPGRLPKYLDRVDRWVMKNKGGTSQGETPIFRISAFTGDEVRFRLSESEGVDLYDE